MKKWEYKLRNFPVLVQGIEAELNRLGSEGWELVGIVAGKDHNELIFKREIPEPNAPTCEEASTAANS